MPLLYIFRVQLITTLRSRGNNRSKSEISPSRRPGKDLRQT